MVTPLSDLSEKLELGDALAGRVRWVRVAGWFWEIMIRTALLS